MNIKQFILITIMLCMMTTFTIGCTSETGKAKKEVEKLLKDSKLPIENYKGDFFEGFLPAELDKDVLKQVNRLNDYIADVDEKRQTLKQTQEGSYSQKIIEIYSQSLERSIQKVNSQKDLIKNKILEINNNRPETLKIVGKVEFDSDNGSKKEHESAVVLYNRGDYSKAINYISVSAINYNTIITAMQIMSGDTIITHPSKEELKRIVKAVKDENGIFAFLMKDSIQ